MAVTGVTLGDLVPPAKAPVLMGLPGPLSLIKPNKDGPLTMDLLLDVFVGVYDELNQPLLRKEKNVQDFVTRFAEVVKLVKENRLSRDQFDIIKVVPGVTMCSDPMSDPMVSAPVSPRSQLGLAFSGHRSRCFWRGPSCPPQSHAGHLCHESLFAMLEM